MKNKCQVHIQFNAAIQSKREMLNGEAYIVYPVIMMTEGVHAGSGGPTLYTSQELAEYHWTWNGMPVSINHPQDDNGSPISCNDPTVYNTQVVGKIFNTVFEDNKLKAEAWLKETVLNALGADVIKALESGNNLEVSTGLFCDAQEVSGDWNGETYNAVATNIRPDHLALLPGGVGACSWKDGCGIRANKGEGMEKESLKYFQVNEDTTKFTFLDNMDLDYTQLIDSAYGLVDSMDDDQYTYYLRKMYPEFMVYTVRPRRGSTGAKTYKRNYTVDNAGKVSFNGDPVEVVIKESIETVNNKATKQTKQKQNKEEGMAKTMQECCPKKVDELIKHNENFTDDDRDVLLAMTEDAFAMVINKAKPIENKEKEPERVNNQEPEKPETNKEKEPEKEEKKMTFDEILANADPEVAESIRNGHRIFQERKRDLVQKIVAHESNKFTEDELKAFPYDHLEKLASFIPEKKGANYVGNAGVHVPVDNGEDAADGVLPDMDFDFTATDK
jgi:hypothetical protein